MCDALKLEASVLSLGHHVARFRDFCARGESGGTANEFKRLNIVDRRPHDLTKNTAKMAQQVSGQKQQGR